MRIGELRGAVIKSEKHVPVINAPDEVKQGRVTVSVVGRGIPRRTTEPTFVGLPVPARRRVHLWWQIGSLQPTRA